MSQKKTIYGGKRSKSLVCRSCDFEVDLLKIDDILCQACSQEKAREKEERKKLREAGLLPPTKPTQWMRFIKATIAANPGKGWNYPRIIKDPEALRIVKQVWDTWDPQLPIPPILGVYEPKEVEPKLRPIEVYPPFAEEISPIMDRSRMTPYGPFRETTQPYPFEWRPIEAYESSEPFFTD